MREKTIRETLWELIFPILLYFLLSMILTGTAELLLPALGEPENAMWLLSLVNGLQIPVFLWLRQRQQRDQAVRSGRGTGRKAWERSFGRQELLLAVLGGVFLSRGFNGVIGLTPLPRLFPAYEAVNASIYGSSLLSQILASAVTASVLEETLMRGLFYDRLRLCLKDRRPAMLAGAFVFALFHGNAVQGVYAFLIGLYFVWLYEQYDSLVPVVAAHGAANLSTIVLEQTDRLDILYSSLPFYFLTTAFCLTAGAFCWSRGRKKGRKI